MTTMKRREFLRRCAQACAYACAAGYGFGALSPSRAAAQGGLSTLALREGPPSRRLSPYFSAAGGGEVECGLCPRGCVLADGQRGVCRVRENAGGKLYSLVYGNPCAVHIDPIEKKPFFHVLPGTESFSIATTGCNLDCKFCQNWEISQAAPEDAPYYDLPPERVAALAVEGGCRSVASTYVEPSIFMEYMIDVGAAARERGLLNVEHSNGYVAERPLKDLCKVLDAACVDLKGFTEAYYREMTGGSLAPVLKTLTRLREAGVYIELVNLMIPGANDGDADIRAMCRFIRDELGPDTPLHFTRFYPMYKLRGLPPTPVETLDRARAAAMEEGLRFVYVGNVPGNPGENTSCPSCGALLIERRGYRTSLKEFRDGKCLKCGYVVPGIWTRGA